MLKKITLGGLLAGLVAALIFGAVNRTNARITEQTGETGRRGQNVEQAAIATPQGNGGRWSQDDQIAPGQGDGGLWTQGEEGQGQGGGRWAQDGVPQADVQPEEWLTLQGTVSSVADDLVEVRTAGGELVPLEGRPLSFAQEQGFSPEEGDEVTLAGFDEDGEFKIGKVTSPSDGVAIMLRDASGRPGWAGRGRGG